MSKKIKRYDIEQDSKLKLKESIEGQWVKYKDYEKVAKKVKELEDISMALSYILPSPMAFDDTNYVPIKTELYHVQYKMAKEMLVNYINSKQK
jgi:hypothetical protein